MSDARVGGVLDAWLTPLRAVRKREWKKQLEGIKDDKERAVKLAELNVQEGVGNLMENSVVEEAIKERGLKVHGCIYDIGNGLLRELGFGTEGPTQPNEHGVDELTPAELGIKDGVAGHESSKDAIPEPKEEKLAESTVVEPATEESKVADSKAAESTTEASKPVEKKEETTDVHVTKDVTTQIKDALTDAKDAATSTVV